MSDDNRVARPIVEALDAAAVRLKRENADLRAMLREIRRTVIASVRGEEHAASLTDEEVDAHAASTPVDVGNLVARMQSAEAERDALSNFSRNNEVALASAVDQLALLRAQVAALTAERDAAQAIIAGRTTPPTDAEIEAHARRSPVGAWLITATDGNRQLVYLWRPFGDSRSEDWEMLRRRMGPFKFTVARWIPIDAEGRPCAWPVVEVK